MDISDVLDSFRAEAESLMTDGCRVEREGPPDPGAVIDPVTGKFPDVPFGLVYLGAAQVQLQGTVLAGRARLSAGDEVTLLRSTLKVPALAARLLVNDRVTVTASTYNPALVGVVFMVTGLLPGSHQTSQKVSIQSVVN
jgi:hypothetical protein